MELTIEQIARVAYEACVTYHAALGGAPRVSWDTAASWVKDDAINNVRALVSGTPVALWHSQRAARLAEQGWSYGQTYDPGQLKHPCATGFEHLSPEARTELRLFVSIVHACNPPVPALVPLPQLSESPAPVVHQISEPAPEQSSPRRSKKQKSGEQA